MAQDLHEPLLQLWNAINERCYAAGQTPLGLVETTVLDDVWMSTNTYVDGFWYWSWAGPDTNGLWLIGFEGAYPDELVLVLPQQIDGDDVYYGGMFVSNRWQTTVEVTTTNHFGAIEGGSVTGFPFVSRALLTTMESKLDALATFYKYPGTNDSWSAYWASTQSVYRMAIYNGLNRFAPRVPALSVAKVWVDSDLGYATNITSNAWGEVTAADYNWDSGTTSTSATAVAGWDTNLAPYRLYAYELDRIYHVVTNLRYTVRAKHKSDEVFVSLTNDYGFGTAVVDRTDTWSVADTAAISNYNASIFSPLSPNNYPFASSIRRVARGHAYDAYNPSIDTYDTTFTVMTISTATLAGVPTNTPCDAYFYLGDFSALYTNSTVFYGASESATNGSGNWVYHSGQHFPFWTYPSPAAWPWDGGSTLAKQETMELVYTATGSTNATIMVSGIGSTNLPAVAEIPVLPVDMYGMNQQDRGFESTDWVIIFDWDFEYK